MRPSRSFVMHVETLCVAVIKRRELAVDRDNRKYDRCPRWARSVGWAVLPLVSWPRVPIRVDCWRLLAVDSQLLPQKKNAWYKHGYSTVLLIIEFGLPVCVCFDAMFLHRTMCDVPCAALWISPSLRPTLASRVCCSLSVQWTDCIVLLQRLSIVLLYRWNPIPSQVLWLNVIFLLLTYQSCVFPGLLLTCPQRLYTVQMQREVYK